MGLFNWLADKKMKRELKKWGLEDAELNMNIEGMDPEDIQKFKKRFEEFIQKHPKLEGMKLDKLPEIMEHKEEIRELVEQNKEEFKEIVQILDQDEE